MKLFLTSPVAYYKKNLRKEATLNIVLKILKASEIKNYLPYELFVRPARSKTQLQSFDDLYGN